MQTTSDAIALSHQSYLGMSEISACFGLNPFKSMVDLYLDKTAEVPKDRIEPAPVGDTSPMYWGLKLERQIAEGFADAMTEIRGEPVKVRSDGNEYKDEFTRTVCHLDYRIVGENSAVECKRPGSIWVGDWGEEFTDAIPPGYLLQCHGQMWRVKSLERVYVPRLVGHKLFIYTVERSEAVNEMLEKRALDFWDYVDRREVPPLDYTHSRFDQTIKRLYPGYNGEVIKLPAHSQAYTDTLDTLAEDRRTLEKAEKIYKRKLREMMGENSFGILPDGKLWSRYIQEFPEEEAPRKARQDHRLKKTTKSKLPAAVRRDYDALTTDDEITH